MPDGTYSVSDIHDCIEYIIKKHEKLTEIPSIYVYLNIIDNRLVFKIKNWYTLELQTSQTMKLFASTKILIDKTRNGDNILNLEVLMRWFYSNEI